MTAISVTELDIQGHLPHTVLVVDTDYRIGHRVGSGFWETVTYGHALGLKIAVAEDEPYRVDRQLFVHVEGRWAEMRRFLLSLEAVMR